MSGWNEPRVVTRRRSGRPGESRPSQAGGWITWAWSEYISSIPARTNSEFAANMLSGGGVSSRTSTFRKLADDFQTPPLKRDMYRSDALNGKWM